MNNPGESEPLPEGERTKPEYPVSIIAASLAAIVATYLLANSSSDVVTKTRGFSAIIATFLAVCVLFYFWQARLKKLEQQALNHRSQEANIDRGLHALDEANEFFAGALKAADTFRLVAHRVNGVVEFKSIVLLLLDRSRSHLTVAEAAGVGTGDRKGEVIRFDDGLASRSFQSQKIETGDEAVAPDSRSAPSVAIPLVRGAEVFGVLQLYFDAEYDLAMAGTSMFEAIGTRVSPLILSSIALERSQENALTDATTDLPNERAFYLILENQIAEATRKRDDRPLTILSMDINDFDDINRRYGHAAGDQALNFVAHTIKDNLRQMDFFARAMNDEFLAILPTASKEISPDVIARIHTGFFGRKLKLSETGSIELELNFGWATFGEDGETADTLLSIARLRKDQSKSIAPNNVLWFQKELVN